MKEKKIVDERVAAEKRNIESLGFKLVLWVLLGSVLWQQYVLKAPFSQFAAEFFIAVGASAFFTIGNSVLGNGQKINTKNAAIRGISMVVTGVVVFVVLSGTRKPLDIVIFIAIFLTINVVVVVLINSLNSYGRNKREKELEE